MSTIRLQVISLQGVFLDEMVDFFKFPGPMGQTGVLKNHAPLLTLMSAGSVSYQTQSISKTFQTLGGIVEFQDNKAVILADYCDSEGLDLLRTQAQKKSEQYKEEKNQVRSFHQLYAELARGPAELASLRGIGQLRSKNKDK